MTGLAESLAETSDDDFYANRRREMVEALQPRIVDQRVLRAMQHVPRHLFVPEDRRRSAYADRPLSIGYGQTISQPFMVALALQAAELNGEEVVLDVGAGSGYQAALLAELARRVVAVERLRELVVRSRSTLRLMRAFDVEIIHGDGRLGHPPRAPYDAIIVAAATETTPQPLIEQLKPGGRLVLPLGSPAHQVLTRIRKSRAGNLESERLVRCTYVPFVGTEEVS
jgi:protein-L-isoaspartate(D-aspartate) O-methyltransferase